MKTSAILFVSSLVATVVGRPAEQAIDAELRPRADARVTLYRNKDFQGHQETLTFPHGVCQTLREGVWRKKVGSAESLAYCEYYRETNCKKLVGWTRDGGDPDLTENGGVSSFKCPG